MLSLRLVYRPIVMTGTVETFAQVMEIAIAARLIVSAELVVRLVPLLPTAYQLALLLA